MNVQFITAVLISFFVIILSTEGTIVRKCEGSNYRKLSDEDVTISNCKKGRCRLRKNTNVSITMNIQPDHDVKSLKTSVSAVIVGIPLPFVGVDGTSACNNFYAEDGVTKIECPLKAGQKYVYKNAFDVLPLYPSLPALDVHWALTESNGKDLVCFEIPAKITPN